MVLIQQEIGERRSVYVVIKWEEGKAPLTGEALVEALTDPEPAGPPMLSHEL